MKIKLNKNNWDSMLNSSMHPLAPNLSEVLEKKFTKSEAIELKEILLPSDQINTVMAKTHMAYLIAHKL